MKVVLNQNSAHLYCQNNRVANTWVIICVRIMSEYSVTPTIHHFSSLGEEFWVLECARLRKMAFHSVNDELIPHYLT